MRSEEELVKAIAWTGTAALGMSDANKRGMMTAICEALMWVNGEDNHFGEVMKKVSAEWDKAIAEIKAANN